MKEMRDAPWDSKRRNSYLHHYRNVLEDRITINELKQWLDELSEQGENRLFRDIELMTARK